jgi:hypothetical protein
MLFLSVKTINNQIKLFICCMGRSSSPVGYGIGIAEVVGSNPTRSTIIIAFVYTNGIESTRV